jgi:rare lipoprotein A
MADGSRFEALGITAASRTLPFGSRVRVTNLENGKSVVVTIRDRGPYFGGRMIDLSLGAARRLGMVKRGVVRVCVEPLPS